MQKHEDGPPVREGFTNDESAISQTCPRCGETVFNQGGYGKCDSCGLTLTFERPLEAE